MSSHSYFASIPHKNGILIISSHSSHQYAGIISITNTGIEENEIFYKYLTPDEYINHGYYTPSELYEGSTDLKFTDKINLSGFGNFNYVGSNDLPSTLYESGIAKGIAYYNNGMYYEAIDEIQWFCDANWYNITEEQQNNALWYLNNAKSKLADRIFESAKNNYNNGQYYEVINEVQRFCDFNWYYMTKDQQDNALWYLNNSKTKLANHLFSSGKKYYRQGLFYEARNAFEEAMRYYEPINDNLWKQTNDYLYNTNEKIKQWECRPVCDKNGNPYKTYDGSNVPLYGAVTGDWTNFTEWAGNGWKYKYYYWGNNKDLVESASEYISLLESYGFTCTMSDNIGGDFAYFYYKRGEDLIIIILDTEESCVIITVCE